MSTEDYRQDPPPVPPCGWCDTAQHMRPNRVLSGKRWWCDGCDHDRTGSPSEFQRLRAQRIADEATTPRQAIAAAREALAASSGDELKENP